MSSFFRGRRIRQTPQMRDFFRETPPLLKEDLIMPYFVVNSGDSSLEKEIATMPGQYQLSLSKLEEHVEKAVDMGLKNVILFGVPAKKDEQATGAWKEDGIIQRATRLLKKRFPSLFVITDVCLCEYMSHGHCGILAKNGQVLNDPTLELLAKTAVSQSAYYGPFRDAAQSAPACGDRKSYQMDPGNGREAMREVFADLEEGADAIIVKPAGPYGDILRQVRDAVDVHVCAYQVSGEYALIRAAGLNGWVDEERVMMESLQGLKRGGADSIITYFAETILAKGLAR